MLSQARQREREPSQSSREHRDIILIRRLSVRLSQFFFFLFRSHQHFHFVRCCLFRRSVALRPSDFELKGKASVTSRAPYRGIAIRVRSYSAILSIRLSLHRPTFPLPRCLPSPSTNSQTHKLAHLLTLTHSLTLFPPIVFQSEAHQGHIRHCCLSGTKPIRRRLKACFFS